MKRDGPGLRLGDEPARRRIVQLPDSRHESILQLCFGTDDRDEPAVGAENRASLTGKAVEFDVVGDATDCAMPLTIGSGVKSKRLVEIEADSIRGPSVPRAAQMKVGQRQRGS